MPRVLLALSITIVVIAAITGAPEDAYAQWEVYDTFSEGRIDPAKWRGFEVAGALASPNTEIERQVILSHWKFGKRRSGTLHEKLVAYGSAASDSGSTSHTTGLQVTDPSAIIGIAAKVAVIDAVAKGCVANSIAARARAQVVGEFFNDGSSSGPGDRTGDIISGIQKHLDSNTGKEIAAFITRCNDSACISQTTLAAHLFSATWHFGQPHILQVAWDAANDQFIYTVNPGGPGEESQVLSYGVSDSDPPALDFKQLSLNLTTSNCLGDQRRTAMEAAFDKAEILPAP